MSSESAIVSQAGRWVSAPLTFARRLQRRDYEMAKETAVFAGALTVTTTFMIPMPVPFAALSTIWPEGCVTSFGRVQVELAAHLTLIEVTFTGTEACSVQPFPL